MQAAAMIVLDLSGTSNGTVFLLTVFIIFHPSNGQFLKLNLFLQSY